MTRVKALDVSSHGGEIPPIRWRTARENGWELAVVQLWGGLPGNTMGPNPHAKQQLVGARAAGLLTAGYIWIPPDTTLDTSELIKVARAAAGDEESHLAFIAPDIEDPQRRRLHPINPEARLGDALAHLHGVRKAIYTSRSMWGPIMANTTVFKSIPLWDADFDRGEDLDATFRPYGGWTERAMLQYKGTTDVHGISADLNVADLERLGIAPAPSIPEHLYANGLSLLAKRFAAIVDWYPLTKAQEGDQVREAAFVAAWREFYDYEVLPRLDWMQRE